MQATILWKMWLKGNIIEVFTTFLNLFKPVCNTWMLIDNSLDPMVIIANGGKGFVEEKILAKFGILLMPKLRMKQEDIGLLDKIANGLKIAHEKIPWKKCR